MTLRIDGKRGHVILLARFKRVITSLTLKPEKRKDFLQGGPLGLELSWLTDRPVERYVSIADGVYAPPRDTMIDVFAPRGRVATRAIGLTDIVTPKQVRTFSDCELRWFYQHLLGLPDPPTATMALGKAIRTALLTNFRYKLESKAEIETEGVVGLFRRAWEQQLTSAISCEDEDPEAIYRSGEALVRIYMHEVAPLIRPTAVERPLRGVISSVRIHAPLDLMNEDGTIIDVRTASAAPARIDPMQRFELTTCSRLAEGASGVVRSDILVASRTPQHVTQAWEVSAADLQWTDALYPLAQHAMQRGYYMPNRNSIHCSRHHCPYWRRCEQDFGGVVEA